MIRHVVLVGLSGSGKTSVGRAVSERLGWSFIDTDAEIERTTGTTVADLFGNRGEVAFRELEGAAMRAALVRTEVVISTGGGAVLDPAIWDARLLGAPESLVVWLDASPAELARRLTAHLDSAGAAASRPLLAGDDLETRIATMREARLAKYELADVVVPVEGRDVASVADDVAELAALQCGNPSRITLTVESSASSIRVGAGARHLLGQVLSKRWPNAQAVWVAADSNLLPHVESFIDGLRDETDAPVSVVPVAAGETSKSVSGVAALWDATLEGGISRGDVVVAFGGGVVGDLAGFAAATVLRGVGLVQVPTTLLSMVDSSVGGKTGINHAMGKNLIGAFYQPPEVVIDPELLGSLPEREFRSGWAEIVKHAVIEASTPGGDPPVLLDVLERNRDALLARKSPLLPWVIRRNVSLKAAVVEADERETGIRAYLNFGHTIGHGIEAAGYSLLHGEAVAVGMCAALEIAREMGMIDVTYRQRVHNLIEAYKLPTTAAVDPVRVRHHMKSDKKKAAGKQKWVLPVGAGRVTISTEVPDATIDRALAAVTGSGAAS